ncbi:hypothetical protein IQ07DRAFT_591692 [Pyrenochaeta sp. DS3sAY3a]|nr:hypothetical protein IQ07DRAFT_591692 [Pyrenochaeta sp. DS3sAY3a]
MLKLLTALHVFPACIDILRAFGQKTAATDESYSGFYFQRNNHTSIAECACTLKFPEQHGRDGPLDPWSLRQMGIYQQTYDDGGGTFVVFHPSKPFLKRFNRATSSHETINMWTLQMMALSATMDNWRWYISDLEKRFTKAKTNAQLTSITPSEPGAYNANITFEDTQDIQVLQDKLSQSLHYLTTNHKIIHHIHEKRTTIFGKEEKENVDTSFIETLMIEASMESDRVKSILKRAEGTQALAQSILDFTCLESLRANSRTMTELTKLSHKEAEMLLDLSMKGSRDNDILKTLALLGLIYLPATLVSSIMGMEYIKVVSKGKRLTIVIEKEMWIFLALVTVLLIVTLGSYYWWVRSKRSKRQKSLSKLQWRKRHLTW